MKWRPDERKFFQGPWQPTRGSRWGPHWGGRVHRPKCLRKVPLLGPWRVWVGWQTKSRWPHTSDIWSTSSSWRKRWRFSLGGTLLGSPQRTSTRLYPTTCPRGLCPGTTWTPKTKPWRATSRDSSSMTNFVDLFLSFRMYFVAMFYQNSGPEIKIFKNKSSKIIFLAQSSKNFMALENWRFKKERKKRSNWKSFVVNLVILVCRLFSSVECPHGLKIQACLSEVGLNSIRPQGSTSGLSPGLVAHTFFLFSFPSATVPARHFQAIPQNL